jgi:peptide chain release factor
MSDMIIHISSGQGPEECRWVVGQLARVFAKEAEKEGLQCEVLDPITSNPASLLFHIRGDTAAAFVDARIGTILWTGTSLFRPAHKRRNWFVGVSLVPPLEDIADLKDEDIEWQAMRASGPGGQHVNKTDSAVRAKHRPTGLVTTAQEQRSQHANRKLAKLKLAMLLSEQREGKNADAERGRWQGNHQLERGKPVRTYVGIDFRKKDR